jgi:HK97 family phage major capsid protein
VTDTLLSVEDLTEALSAIVDGAAERDLTDAEEVEIAALEGQLELAQARRERTEAFRARQADRTKIVTPALHIDRTKDSDANAVLEAAFTAYLRTGRENADLQELRNAQSEGTPSEGGFLVPDGFRQRLVDRMKAFGGLANVVSEITTDSGNNLEWPTLDDTANVGEVVDEGGTFSGGADLVFGTASLGAYSYMAGGAGGTPLRISRELVQDAAFDVEGLVTDKLGMRAARIQATHLISGTGVKQPQGIVTGRTPVASAAATLTYDDLLGYVHSIDPAYRQGPCRWAFNDKTLKALRLIKDTTGRPLLGARTTPPSPPIRAGRRSSATRSRSIRASRTSPPTARRSSACSAISPRAT